MTRKQTATCMLCEAVCGLEVTVGPSDVVGEERLVRVEGDKLDPFSRGHICPKAAALDDIRLDPDRILYPQRRNKQGDFERVTWEEALTEAAERLYEIRHEHGPHAVGMYMGNPVAHSYAALFGSVALAKTIGSYSRFSATSADQLPQMVASLLMFGHQFVIPVPDLETVEHLLILGANPVVSNGSLMTAPGMRHRLQEIKARGGRVIVIDPRRTETAELAGEHFFIQPGTDAFLVFAMIHTIFEEDLTHLGRLASFSRGLEELREAAREFSPESVAPITGITATDIRTLARDFAKAKRAACYARIGACTQEFGGLTSWLTLALDVITGHLDEPGGKMFATPAADLNAISTKIGMRGSFGRHRTRVRNLPDFSGELPVAALAEEIETPGKNQIRALVTMAGNPALSAPNSRAISRALGKLDFMVSIDIYKNETTKHANLILPPTFGLERDHYDAVLYVLAVRNSARYANAVFKPRGETRDDWDITLDLAARIARRNRATPTNLATRAVIASLRKMGSKRVLDTMLRMGPHKISVAKLQASPHGMDLGALESRLPKLLGPGRFIELAPRVLLDDVPRLRAKLKTFVAEAKERDAASFMLIGRRHLRSNNSWMHNSDRLTKGPKLCTLLMHPLDAQAIDLAAGEDVIIESRTGSVIAPLEITDAMSRGVVSLPHGWGHDRKGTALSVAESRAGVSVNDLTDEQFIDGLTANAGFSGISVRVQKAATTTA